MTDIPQGSGWWQASDGRWYPPQPRNRVSASARHSVHPAMWLAVLIAAGFVAFTITRWATHDGAPTTATDAPSEDTRSSSLDSATTVDAALAGEQTVVPFADGLRLRVPKGWEVTPVTVDASTMGDGCPLGQGLITSAEPGPHVWIDVKMASPRPGCIEHTPPLNGNHGAYARVEDVVDPQNVTTTTTTTGLVTAFTQTYTECMNSCRESVDAVVLLQLTAPPNAALPTVMFIADAAEVTPAQLTLLAKTITTASPH